ncbi:MAG TPA: cytochrome c biogenesis protein CcdA [Vicinamibacterales bacterium]|nr:cytochrome c biogenesis protein CcdA [Vicinamibacterales bacterium]
MGDVSFLAAFGAGVLSFISPCVLPLVPGYISFVSGVSFDQMQTADAASRAATRRQMLITSLAFVLGFSLVFICLGASATAIGHLLRHQKTILERIAGALIIIFGLHLAGVFRIKWLDKDTRVQTSGRPASPIGAFLVGLAFAFGWTPCIGPILGGILAIAGSKNSVGEGVGLLAVYSAGLGIPFLVTSIAIDRFFVASKRIRKYYKPIEIASGALLVVLGVLIFTNRFTILSNYFSKFLPTF